MTPRGVKPRLVVVVAPVCVAGAVALAWAAVALATTSYGVTTLLGVGALLLASTFADRFPVPLEGAESGGVSLSFVFGVSGIVLFGWAAGVLVFVAAPALTQVVARRPAVRIGYNVAVLALAATAAGSLATVVDRGGATGVVARIAAAAGTQYVINLTLIAAVIAVSTGRPFPGVLRSKLRSTLIPFSLMASAALMLVVLWERSPVLSVALVGPLLAIQLYQRAIVQTLRAMRLALTDPLTGLGNQRHFHDRLGRELSRARQNRIPLAISLVDVDDFKLINDRFGHPVGDRVLSHLGVCLRQDGEAFRLGGDEFALLLPGYDETSAAAVGRSVVQRIGELALDHGARVTASVGIAAFPADAAERDELIRLADSALYWAKECGKNCVRVYRPDVVELGDLKRMPSGPDRAARFRAAAGLAKAVGARDAYTGGHSERVAELAARVAVRIGLAEEEIELTRLAARLHDLGKLAIPEEILRKPGPLTDGERVVLQRHPQIAFGMLDSLGVEPVADWVLHHHERWDGRGYPDGLSGEKIPLGARIIFVADAYDAMTSERIYRPHISPDEAMCELEQCAGTQFDPGVVSAFAEELASDAPRALSATG